MQLPVGEGFGVRRSLKAFGAEVRRRVFQSGEARSPQESEEKYVNTMASFQRDLSVLATIGKSSGFSILFVLQPLATWISKKLVREEIELFEILDRLPNDWEALAKSLRSQYPRYIVDLKRICEELGVCFLDMNSNPLFAGHDWFFVDRVHLTDQGYRLVARIIQKELGI